jgi:hypothetical protein
MILPKGCSSFTDRKMCRMLQNNSEDVERCGSVHPNYPELICIKRGGKCVVDAHMGKIKHRCYTEVVVWGRAYEGPNAWPTTYRVIHIKDNADEKDDL